MIVIVCLSRQVPLQLGRTRKALHLSVSGYLIDSVMNTQSGWGELLIKQLPPEWNMPDLVRTVIGDEAIHMPGFLTDSYYDVMLHGPNSWLCQDIFEFLDLINYVF